MLRRVLPLLLVIAACSGEEHLGAIEQAEFDRVPDLDGFADDFAASMRDDRVSHCDPDFELDPEETTPTTLFGAAGVRYGYTGTVGGVVVERLLAHASLVEDRLHLVTAKFLADEGACLARESELPIDTAEDVEPILDAVAAGSTR